MNSIFQRNSQNIKSKNSSKYSLFSLPFDHELCVDHMTRKHPESECIKLQVYFNIMYPIKSTLDLPLLTLDELFQKEVLDYQRKLFEHKQTIIDFKGKTVAEIEQIYRKLVAYIMRYTRLSPDTDMKDIREATGNLPFQLIYSSGS